MSARFELNPGFLAELERMLNPKAQLVAETVKTFLVEKLSVEGGPSIPGDYPAKDTGALVDSISSQEVTPGRWEVGAFDAPPEAFYLEFPAPEGSPYRKLTPNGARPWATKARDDSELHDRITAALKGG